MVETLIHVSPGKPNKPSSSALKFVVGGVSSLSNITVQKTTLFVLSIIIQDEPEQEGEPLELAKPKTVRSLPNKPAKEPLPAKPVRVEVKKPSEAVKTCKIDERLVGNSSQAPTPKIVLAQAPTKV